MSTARRTHPWAFALALALPGAANAQLGGEALPDLSGISGAISGTVAPKTTGTFSSGLKVPSVSPGAAAKGIGRQLRTGVEAKTGQKNAGLLALENEMPQTLAKIETALQGLALAKRDLGVAVGYFFVTSYEAATGRTVPEKASIAAGKTVAKAVGARWAARFKAIEPAQQESMYETLLVTPTLLSALATQFDKVGKTQDAQGMRQASAAIFEKLIGTAPSAVKIDDNGIITGLKGGATVIRRTPTNTTRTTRTTRRNNRPEKPVLPVGGLTPASLNGAKVFVRYTIPTMYSTDTIHELVMFPDGSAFDGLPSDPLPSFDAATIRRYSKKYDIGTWKQSGNRLTLTFDGKPETYVKHSSGGWADPENASGSYNIYFPIRVATKAQLAGAWKHKSLTTMGMAGGGAPMVAAGSNKDLTFNPNGTYAGAGERFASATTANMGDAFKSGGDVTTNSNNKTGGSGKWRLDGPLLTTVENGRRGVQLAYILPNWNKASEPPQVLIGGDWWFRPGKGF